MEFGESSVLRSSGQSGSPPFSETMETGEQIYVSETCSSHKNMAPFSCKCVWGAPVGLVEVGGGGGGALEAFLCELQHKP